MGVNFLLLFLTCVHVRFSLVQGSAINASHTDVGGVYGGRILHGMKADPKKFPFAVRLEAPEKVLCGGSIISSHWILTAAHCFHNVICKTIGISPSSWVVGDAPKYHALECTANAKYRYPNYPDDIGLIKTAVDLVKVGKLAVIDLPDPDDHFYAGTPASIVGWGVTELNSNPPYLISGDTEIQLWEKCNQAYKAWKTIKINTMVWEYMCVGGHGRLPDGACFGDSGGPVIIQKKLAGIMVAAIHDERYRCIVGTPILSLPVTEYLPWINSHIYPDNRHFK